MSFHRKCLSAVIAMSVVFGVSGCSSFLERIASKDASQTLEAAMEVFYNDPVYGLKVFDDSYEATALSDENMELAYRGIERSSYEIGEGKVSRDRSTVRFTVTFFDVTDTDDLPSMGTYDEILEAFEECDTDDIKIDFVLVSSKSDWYIEDMSELNEVFFAPYESIVYIDDNGMPTSFCQAFFDECAVEGVWYDPYFANPLETNSLRSPEALLAVFYFDRPMYINFTAELIKDGDVISTRDADTNGQTIAYVEFYGDQYGPGSYEVRLKFDGGQVLTTDDLTVTR